MRSRRCFPLLILVATLTGCATVGPKSIRDARFDYNRAIIETRNEQLLTNLVRLRYRDPPYFLEVSSVSTQYVLGAGAGASLGSLGSDAVGGASGTFHYEERPTITYLPLKGDEFVNRLLSPVPMETIMLLTSTGWRVDRVMRCCVQRVNEVWNAPSASGPTPDATPNYEAFLEMANLLEEIRGLEAMELRVRRVQEDETPPARTLEKDGKQYLLSLRFLPVPEAAAPLGRLKELLDLDPTLDEFYLTRNPMFRAPNEIGLLPRSLSGTMAYLSQAVEPPQRDVDAGRVTVTRNRDGSEFDWAALAGGLFRVRSSETPPEDAFVRVRYRDAWFYIDDADLTTKSTFSLLDQLFQLQAGDLGGAAPLLTLPLN